VNTRFDVPHSRFNDVGRDQFEAAGLQVLVESEQAGVHLATCDPQGLGPLPQGVLRRFAVALPAEIPFHSYAGGEYEGRALVKGRVKTLALLKWLEAESPEIPWIERMFQEGGAQESKR